MLAAKAVEGGAELQLEYDPLIGIGQVSGYEDGKVLSDTPFHLRGYLYYHGAWVENAAGDKHYRLAGIAGGAVLDPELHLDVVSLGLIRSVDVQKSPVEVKMLLTTPFCPYGPWLVQQVKETAENASGQEAKVEVLAEQWHPEMMEDPTLLGFF